MCPDTGGWDRAGNLISADGFIRDERFACSVPKSSPACDELGIPQARAASQTYSSCISRHLTRWLGWAGGPGSAQAVAEHGPASNWCRWKDVNSVLPLAMGINSAHPANLVQPPRPLCCLTRVSGFRLGKAQEPQRAAGT